MDDVTAENMDNLWADPTKNPSLDGFETMRMFNTPKRKAVAGRTTDFTKEITALVYVFLQRGNDINKTISKTSEVGKRHLQNPKDIPGIVKDPRTAPEGRQLAVTLPGVPAIFPTIVEKVLLERPSALVIKIYEEYKLPTWAAPGGLMSLYPASGPYKTLSTTAKAMFSIFSIALSHFPHSQNPHPMGPNAQAVLNIPNPSFSSTYSDDSRRLHGPWTPGLPRELSKVQKANFSQYL